MSITVFLIGISNVGQEETWLYLEHLYLPY